MGKTADQMQYAGMTDTERNAARRDEDDAGEQAEEVHEEIRSTKNTIGPTALAAARHGSSPLLRACLRNRHDEPQIYEAYLHEEKAMLVQDPAHPRWKAEDLESLKAKALFWIECATRASGSTRRSSTPFTPELSEILKTATSWQWAWSRVPWVKPSRRAELDARSPGRSLADLHPINDLPLGPGVKEAFDNLTRWIHRASLKDLEPLLKPEQRHMWPIVLAHTQKGRERANLIGGEKEGALWQVVTPESIHGLLHNPDVSREVIMDLALEELVENTRLANGQGSQWVAMAAFFRDCPKHGVSFTGNHITQIRELVTAYAAGDDEIAVSSMLNLIATIKEAGNDHRCRKILSKRLGSQGRALMMEGLAGKPWLETAELVLPRPWRSEILSQALARARGDQLHGLTAPDMVNLIGHKDEVVRKEARAIAAQLFHGHKPGNRKIRT